MNRTVWILVVTAVLLLGGYVLYNHWKERPPAFLIGLLTSTDEPPPLPAGDMAPLTAPDGFVATIFARDLKGARVLALDPKGTLLLSQTSEGRIVALPDADADGKADRAVPVLDGLNEPHGILFDCPYTGDASADQDACRLYVAETDMLASYAYDPDTYRASGREELLALPSGSGHYTRTLLMHPDGRRILVSVGSSCNVCTESEPQRASVVAYDIETRSARIFASGLRNTVFMAIHPVTGEVWGTDNGRDVIGDDIPPDELNIIREGGNYGWPQCYGKNAYDTDFDALGSAPDTCAGLVPSHVDLPAHSAALGLAFVPEEGWPEDMWHDALVAFHGSWNRSDPTGYKVVRVDLSADGTRSSGIADFLTGFLAPGADEDDAIGRPVAVVTMPGGLAYVTDDRAGAVYRLVWQRP